MLKMFQSLIAIAGKICYTDTVDIQSFRYENENKIHG